MMTNDVRHRVLLIDDDQAVLDAMAVAFKLRGFAVTKAISGTSAVEAVQGGSIELAITDLKMPGMSGLETLEALKQINPSLPVIVITGFATEGTASDCETLGAFGLILKPFDLDDLFNLVDQALRNRGHAA